MGDGRRLGGGSPQKGVALAKERKGRGPVGGTRTGTETTASGNDGRIATAAQDLPTQRETLR
jgi:hypothetical protein